MGKLRHTGREGPWRLLGSSLPGGGRLGTLSPTDRGSGSPAGQGLWGALRHLPPAPLAWGVGLGLGRARPLRSHSTRNLALLYVTAKEGGGIGLRPNIFLVNLYNKRVQSISSSSACFPVLRGMRGGGSHLQTQSGGVANAIPAPRPQVLARLAMFTMPGSSPLSRSEHGKSGAAQPSESFADGSLPRGHRGRGASPPVPWPPCQRSDSALWALQ